MRLHTYLWAAIGFASTGCQSTSAASIGPETRSEAAVQVQMAAVTEEPVATVVRFSGSLRGREDTQLAANASGRVARTFVERGSQVRAGNLLVQLDSRAASLNATEAAANAEMASEQARNAERQCARYVELQKSASLSPSEYDRQMAQCENARRTEQAARARAELSTQSLNDGTIRAPFSGFVNERFVSVGQYVRPDSPVVSLVDLERLRLEFTLPESQLQALKIGSPVDFTVAAYPNRTFAGIVKYVGAAVRASTRDVVAEAEVNNPDHALRPGMFVMASMPLSSRPAAVVPRSALRQRDGQTFIFVAVDKRLEERVVQLGGALSAERVAIVSGAKPGEQVVVNPSSDVQNGKRVD